MDPHEALFMVDDMAEQATWASTSWSHEGVLATLSKLVNAATMVIGLSIEAQWLLAKEVAPREQVRLCCHASSFWVHCAGRSFGWVAWLSFLPLQELMRASMEKSQFLRLAFHMRLGGTMNHDRLAKAEAEVQRLWEELETSQ